MIGEEDVIANRPYSTTVKCVSSVGHVLAINADEFYARFSKDERSWTKFIQNCQEKDKVTTQYSIQAV